jgi:NADPH2:quinone reductase
MHAVVCREWGAPENLGVEDIPLPALRDGAVRIKVHAAGVNFADLLLVAGQYQEKPAFPFTPGAEAAGEITEIGSGVKGFNIGDRVMALTGLGAFADQAVVDAQRVLPIPPTMEFSTAAAFPVAYGTSHGALEWRARLQPGEWLLVTGAAGGVGLTAVEIGKAMGARVIACAGSAEKLAIAQQHGADYLIDYSKEDIRERVKAITDGRGADVIYDPVGGDAFDASLRFIAWGGRIIIIGFAAGRVSQIPANIVLVKNIDVIGFYWGSYQAHKPELLRGSFTQLFRWFQEGKLRPHVSHRLPLDQAAEALTLLKQRRSTGKVVLVPAT